MAQLTLEIPSDLERVLENLAAEQQTSVEQIAVERLIALVPRPGSPRAILESINKLPRLEPADVDALRASIHAGRIPSRDRGVFD